MNSPMRDSGLQSHAEEYFGFLISGEGYKLTESTPYRVRFESPTVFVELVYDGRHSYELGLLVDKIGSRISPYTIGEILRLRRAPEAASFSLLQVTTAEALARWIEKMAGLFRRFGSDLIAGHEQSFNDLEQHRRKDVQTYALDRALRAACAQAEAAWQKKDYASVVKALNPLRFALSATEVRKLEFAKNKLRE